MPTPAPHTVTPAPAAQGPTLGVIANPVSARDIRRVVANAGNLQITDRVNIVLRVLSSAAACGVSRALVMPDRGGIRALLERHFKRHAHHHHDEAHATRYPQVEFLDMVPTSTVDDTFAATRLLLCAGVSAIVVLGGDGTHRAVARELVAAGSRVPIVGLSTGTNNAFPEMREPTIAGIAAGLFACGRLAAREALAPNKLVQVHIADPVRDEDRRDIAIVDAVVTHDRSVGARALWKTSSLDAMYLAFAEPQAIGLSAIGGLLQPVGRREPGGLAVQLAADGAPAALTLAAPIAPGMVRPVRIAHWQRMAAGTPLPVAATAGTVALDGERELAFEPGQSVQMTLHEDAFFSVDVARCMRVAADRGLLRDVAVVTAPTPSPATT
ncbi:MAG TPA: NAD(+)/NADH kinase [Burkholderiaceae bacterium]|nr:NAD(+)/NADH kinase [Burkholderiaceae bacterium]